MSILSTCRAADHKETLQTCQRPHDISLSQSSANSHVALEGSGSDNVMASDATSVSNTLDFPLSPGHHETALYGSVCDFSPTDMGSSSREARRSQDNVYATRPGQENVATAKAPVYDDTEADESSSKGETRYDCPDICLPASSDDRSEYATLEEYAQKDETASRCTGDESLLCASGVDLADSSDYLIPQDCVLTANANTIVYESTEE